jgi:hypothetical protein
MEKLMFEHTNLKLDLVCRAFERLVRGGSRFDPVTPTDGPNNYRESIIEWVRKMVNEARSEDPYEGGAFIDVDLRLGVRPEDDQLHLRWRSGHREVKIVIFFGDDIFAVTTVRADREGDPPLMDVFEGHRFLEHSL